MVVPLPHPSGASGWLNAPSNRELTAQGSALVREELAKLGSRRTRTAKTRG